MELMNKAFVECSDRLAGSGLSADQASHIRDTEMQFGTLMRCVRNADEDCNLELAAPIRRSSMGSRPQVGPSDIIEPKNVPSWMDQAVLVSARNERPASDLGMGKWTFLLRSGNFSHWALSQQKS